jgi:hypothetical protein
MHDDDRKLRVQIDPDHGEGVTEMTEAEARAAADAYQTVLVHLRCGPAWVCSDWTVPHVGKMVATLAEMAAEALVIARKAEGLSHAEATGAAQAELEEHLAAIEIAMMERGLELYRPNLLVTTDPTPDNPDGVNEAGHQP